MTLAVYGKGGLGHEIYELACRINLAEGCFDEMIFVDDRAEADRDEGTGARVMTFEQATAAFTPDELTFAIGVGEPLVRHTLYVKIKEAGYKMATLVHPDVTIPKSSCVDGAVICKYVFISCNTRIGANSLLLPLVCVGHDCDFGESCVVASGAQIAGSVKLGNRVYIGMATAVKETMTVGTDSIVSMSSSVVREIPENVIALGNPARAMRNNLEHRVFG